MKDASRYMTAGEFVDYLLIVIEHVEAGGKICRKHWPLGMIKDGKCEKCGH